MSKHSILLLFLLLLSKFTLAQKAVTTKENTVDPDSIGMVDASLLPTTMPLLLFDDEKEKTAKKEKKKKAKKNIWFGIKTQKSFTKRELRGQTYYEFFNFTIATREPNPYIRDVYWYDSKDKSIKTKGYTPGTGYLLHGPYERTVNDEIVESGMFYYGTKHKTWMLFDDQNILQDKTHFDEGWPKEAKISFFDPTTRAIEQIIPVQYGLEEGNFFHFYESEQVAVTGEYKFGEKVGLWTEYWDNKNTKAIRKREIQYQEEPYTRNFRPFIRAEWDKDGNLIYRNEKK
jgi:antitoxin component YwqK of YwqJK toxin-antitoxin module